MFFDDSPHTIDKNFNDAFLDGLNDAEDKLSAISKEINTYGIKAFKYPERFVFLNNHTINKNNKNKKNMMHFWHMHLKIKL
jgi:hypothetical protein